MELQLGKTDESHIIRTVEYWDIQRKRYPQYDHCAVIVAEEITGRFLNVISLFNGAIPLIAIQMKAMKVGEQGTTLVFTTVLKEVTLGPEEDDERSEPATDRAYWERKSTPATMAIADQILLLIKSFAPNARWLYRSAHVGLTESGRANNFAACWPQKSRLLLLIRLPQSREVDAELSAAGMDVMSYDSRNSSYRIRLAGSDIVQNRDLLQRLLMEARRRSVG